MHCLASEIKIILFVHGWLVRASLLVTLYVARELARPLENERLCPESSNRHATKRVTDSFKIREIEQLADTLDRMVEQVKAWAEEIETACVSSKPPTSSKVSFSHDIHELRTPLNAHYRLCSSCPGWLLR